MCGGKGIETFKEGAWANNPIAIQVLGICSALAVTNKLSNSLVMGAALLFVCVGSNVIVSLLRNHTPHRIRMIAEVAIIATFVIVFDQVLRAFFPAMSKQLGPYVGLIITNCIVMGRAEAFALQNGPVLSIVDGIANGVGYGVVLALIAIARELFGTGGLMGYKILSDSWYTPNQIMVLAPGAFFVLGIVIAVFNAIKGPVPEESK
ncbi:MAG: NADH:ubiquinone reductase (Na(+)-transporting) subunit D [Phycisphaerae bacterium]|nr:NADH:ubiquinone reductase (Na(+)-transporting) subunit D [Phycisphaerae bacterium]